MKTHQDSVCFFVLLKLAKPATENLNATLPLYKEIGFQKNLQFECLADASVRHNGLHEEAFASKVSKYLHQNIFLNQPNQLSLINNSKYQSTVDQF